MATRQQIQKHLDWLLGVEICCVVKSKNGSEKWHCGSDVAPILESWSEMDPKKSSKDFTFFIVTRRRNGFEEWRIKVDIERWLRSDLVNNGKPHRLDAPAKFNSKTCEEQWWNDGKLHRADGPAITWHNGSVEWWINGVRMTKDEHLMFVDSLIVE